MTEIRPDVLNELLRTAIEDDQFRQNAVNNLEGTLQSYGFELNSEEMEEVRSFQGHFLDWSDNELLLGLNRVRPGSSFGHFRWGRPNKHEL
jgi:hypothetical protein